jgi:hypothetical protein
LSISRKVASILDLSCRQSTAVKYAEGIAGKAKCIAFALQLTAFEWYPSQGLFSAPVAQIRALLLGPGLGVLLAHSIDRARMQAQFFAAALREFVQVKTGMPAPVKTQSIFLPVVTEIPDEVDSPALLVQQAVQRLHPVSVHEDHGCFFRKSSMARRIGLATERPVYSDSVSRRSTDGSVKYVFVRFMFTQYATFQELNMFSRSKPGAGKASACAPFTPRPEGRGFSEQI